MHAGTCKYYWRCNYCNFVLGGKAFQNAKARIHLSGDSSLRNGTVAVVCPSAPTHVKKQFQLLVATKRAEIKDENARRKRKGELLKLPTTKKQSKLRVGEPAMPDDMVDECWANAFFGLDIPSNKINSSLFKEAVAATKRSTPGYKLPHRHKLYGAILDRLYNKCVTEQKELLTNHSGYGRCLTGDGATIQGTKFINFLVHEHGKGVMLCKIRDCTERLKEVGSIDSTFIAHEMIATIRYCH